MDNWGEKMEYCFSRLEERILSAVDKTDTDILFDGFRQISLPTLVTGVGGSSVVSAYFSKVIRTKNNVICNEVMPRDMLYMPLDGYRNVVACSYSGKNIGVKASFANGLKKYLYSVNTIEGTEPLQYTVSEEEESFVSVSGTLIPMSLLLLYYADDDTDLLKEIIRTSVNWSGLPSSKVIEVLYGYEQSTAARMLESTMTEGALAAPVLHEKYNYCHGRCQLNDEQKNDLIYFPGDNGMDEIYEIELPTFYRSVTRMEGRYSDPVVNDFYLTYQSLLLCKAIAEDKGKDLSRKNVPDISDKLYLYIGDM